MFPSAKVSYNFHELSDTHFVEVIPKDIYYGNEFFKQTEEELLVEFIGKYPLESLCFLTADSIVPIENISLTFIGETYKDHNSFVLK